MSLEEMGSFFDSRIDSYEAYMLREGNPIYAEVGQLIPDTPGLKLLDLGCGTGLELDEIFRVNPMVQVTGVDIAEKLLKKLSQKHATRKNQLNLIKADYLKYDFKKNAFNIVISVQTLHHFPREEKVILYKKVFAALLPDGFYIESDYYAPDRAFQDFRLAEYKRLRAEQGITSGYYHYDIPYTVMYQIEMLMEAGFKSIETINPREKGAILLAKK